MLRKRLKNLLPVLSVFLLLIFLAAQPVFAAGARGSSKGNPYPLLTGMRIDISRVFGSSRYGTMRYSSEDPGVASVSKKGIVKGMGPGETVISVYVDRNGADAQRLGRYFVKVYEADLPDTLEASGPGAKLNGMMTYFQGTGLRPSFSSSDPAVASIASDTGEITVKGYGTTVLTASFPGGYERETVLHVSAPYDGHFPSHAPLGKGVGAMPGRVVWSHEPASVTWDGYGYWWEPSHFDANVIREMVSRCIAELAGVSRASEGWNRLFTAHNASHGVSGGYRAGQKISIKCNFNGSGAYNDNPHGMTQESYTNPVLLQCLLLSLVQDAGISPDCITIYDAGRIIPDYIQEMCTAGVLSGVTVRCRDIGGDLDAVPDRNAPVTWSKPLGGSQCYYPTCVTGADYIINLANLKGHVYGITLCGKNHFGSIMNENRMRVPQQAGLHSFVMGQKMGDYSPLVDLMASYTLGQKTVLYLLDAFLCPPGESVDISPANTTWKQPPFNGSFTSSLFVSQDPVAIDSVGADFLANEPVIQERNGSVKNTMGIENYLHEAAQAANPPSGTVYTDGRGNRVTNLGVHEHWNNSTEKKYSRNLGKDEGIELIQLEPSH